MPRKHCSGNPPDSTRLALLQEYYVPWSMKPSLEWSLGRGHGWEERIGWGLNAWTLKGHCHPSTHGYKAQGPWLHHQILWASKRGSKPRRISLWLLLLSGLDGCARWPQSEPCSDLIWFTAEPKCWKHRLWCRVDLGLGVDFATQ